MPAPPPTAVPMAAPFLPPTMRADDRAAGRRRADLQRVLFLGRCRRAADRCGLDLVAFVVAARRQRSRSARRHARGPSPWPERVALGHDAADARAFAQAPSRRGWRSAATRCACDRLLRRGWCRSRRPCRARPASSCPAGIVTSRHVPARLPARRARRQPRRSARPRLADRRAGARRVAGAVDGRRQRAASRRRRRRRCTATAGDSSRPAHEPIVINRMSRLTSAELVQGCPPPVEVAKYSNVELASAALGAQNVKMTWLR